MWLYCLHLFSFHCHHEVLEEEDDESTFGIDEEELVQVALSRFTVETVHICQWEV